MVASERTLTLSDMLRKQSEILAGDGMDTEAVAASTEAQHLRLLALLS